MWVAFAGGDAFAVPSLRLLAATSGIDVCAVATNPPRPAGRGLQLRPGPVAETAKQLGIEPEVPVTDAALAALVSRSQADFLVVCAYGRMLRKDSLAAAKVACVNVHASLLPCWRGAAPVERAIIAGDSKTGVTTMLVEPKLDAGPILLQREYALSGAETGGSVRADLADMGAQLLVETLSDFTAIAARKQDDAQATYAPKISNEETWLDLSLPAADLERRVRAFAPAPCARMQFGSTTLKILHAEALAGAGEPGEVLAADGQQGLIVATGCGSLKMLRVQPAGGKQMDAQDYARGLRSKPAGASGKSSGPRSSAG